eukprot:6181796-Pleurochrysis_carterae.AAC.1
MEAGQVGQWISEANSGRSKFVDVGTALCFARFLATLHATAGVLVVCEPAYASKPARAYHQNQERRADSDWARTFDEFGLQGL